MYDLILYDTSNFENFPIGGQLTSIRNFLKYIANCQPNFASRILLIGVTTEAKKIGKVSVVDMDGVRFDFLPVLYRDSDLSNVQKSMRIAYLKALLQMNRMAGIHKRSVHYIHTPEAYIAVKMKNPFSKTVVFSHGSFFNMVEGFRFFQNNKFVHILFNMFIICLIKSADLIVTLDEKSESQYRNYTKKVCRAENSIILPEEPPVRTDCHLPIRLLFVGRLSKVKRVDEIIRAMEQLWEQAHLTVIGDGEERHSLEALLVEKKLDNNVTFLGSLPPETIGTHMRNSDILVMNSIMEGKPMTILEAMSYGLPIVTTPVGGIPELVTEGKNTEFTDGTAVEIVNAVKTICAAYPTYAENSQERSQKYDYRSVNRDLFEKLLKLN